MRQGLHSAPPVAAEGFVLAGGRSTRMGRDKALISISGRTLLDLALDRLRVLPLAAPCAPRIAGSRADLASYAPVVEDIHPGCGPLSGMEAALSATSEPFNVFLPIDLPLVPAGFLAWMLRRASATGAWVTFPRVDGRAQPLCAVYHRSLLPYITRLILAGEYPVTQALARIKDIAGRERSIDRFEDVFDLEWLAATYPELHTFSPVPVDRWFHNCNSPQDLAALDLAAKPR